MAHWQIRGEYMETCNCTLLCPCITSNLAATPTEGDCKAAVAMRIDEGVKDGVTLDCKAYRFGGGREPAIVGGCCKFVLLRARPDAKPALRSVEDVRNAETIPSWQPGATEVFTRELPPALMRSEVVTHRLLQALLAPRVGKDLHDGSPTPRSSLSCAHPRLTC